MTWTKVVLLLAVLSFLCAGVVGFVSRTPASVRAAQPGATDPSLGPRFDDDDVARHGAYRGPAYLGFALGTILTIVTLLVLARGPLPDLIDRVGSWRGGWVTQALVAAALVTVILALVSLPMSFVRGYVVAHDWGLSTQSFGGWVGDHVRSIGVGVVIAAITATVFYALVRSVPRWWWVAGWATFSLLSVLLTFLWPILIAPLFNKFTPLDDPVLTKRVLTLADQAGVSVKEVLVVDASKRTTAENAYVAGIGGSKQLVLYDTLLANGDADETSFVVAHELGHKAKNHVVKGLIVSSVGLLIGFAVLYVLSREAGVGLWHWGRSTSFADVRSLPLLVAFVTIAGLLTLPIQNGLSRRFEREADTTAIRLTQDPDTAVRVFRRLAFSNIADLRPNPAMTWLLFSHPPIPDRIAAAVAESRSAP